MNLLKKLLTILLSLEVAMSAGTLVGCTPNTPDTPNPGGGYEQPLPGEGTEDNKYVNYSTILQKVLTDTTYNGDAWRYTNDPNYRKLAIYDPVPYAFLQDKGYNILDIKENRVKHITQVYIKDSEPNKLYIDCKIEHKSTVDYYANYVLKYDITDKEIKELNWLYAGKHISGEYYTYCQAPQFIQELSYQRTPTLVTESYISVDALANMQSSVTNKEPFNLSVKNSSITLLSIEDASNEYPPTVQFIYPNYYLTFAIRSLSSSGSYGVIKMLGTSRYFTEIDNKTILTTKAYNIREPEWKEQYLQSKENVTNYDKKTNLVNELTNVFKHDGVLESELK